MFDDVIGMREQVLRRMIGEGRWTYNYLFLDASVSVTFTINYYYSFIINYCF